LADQQEEEKKDHQAEDAEEENPGFEEESGFLEDAPQYYQPGIIP
jgi:hypothetical protein